MRILSIGSMACALCLTAEAAVLGQAPQAPPPPPPPGQANVIVTRPTNETPGMDLIPVPTVPPITDHSIAGLCAGSPLESLNWERVYSLALIRDRDGKGRVAKTLDPKVLADQAARNGVPDFARFIKEFLSARPDGGWAFRDPSEAYLRLLCRIQTIENARRNVAVHENLMKLVAELIHGSSAGLSQMDVDLVFASLLRARQELANEIGQFRDGLDDMRICLGLSPHAPVVPDRQCLAAFRTTFDAVENWSRSPDRNLVVLRELVQRLPNLGEVMVNGRAILGKIEVSPEPTEGLLKELADFAIKNRGEQAKAKASEQADAQVERQIRRRIRHLFEMRRAYEGEKHTYEMNIRLKDQSFERLTGPALASVSPRSPLLDGLLEHVNRIRKVEDRLIGLWVDFRSERLALYRDLGTLPYTDWESFYKGLSAE